MKPDKLANLDKRLDDRYAAQVKYVETELAHLRAEFAAQFTAAEKYAAVVLAATHRQTADLRAMLDERYETQTKAVDAAFAAQQLAMRTSLAAAETAVATALISAEKAVTKAEVAADKRFELLNELRVGVASKEQIEAVEKQITDLAARIDRTEGIVQGSHDQRDTARQGSTLLIAVLVGILGVATLALGVYAATHHHP